MSLVFEDINLKLNEDYTETSYIQNISSEIVFNGKKEISNAKRIIILNSNGKQKNERQISIKTKESEVVLAKSVKHQGAITSKILSLTNDVVISIDDFGAIKTIENYEYLKGKWKNLRSELEKMYEGFVAETYFEGIEKKIMNPEKLISDFKQNRFYGLFFRGLYNRNNDFKETTVSVDNCVNHIPIYVDESILVKSFNKKDNKLVMRISGKLNEDKTLMTKIENHFKRNGGRIDVRFELSDYVGLFEFNSSSGLLKKGEISIETKYGSIYSRKDIFQVKAIEDYTL